MSKRIKLNSHRVTVTCNQKVRMNVGPEEVSTYQIVPLCGILTSSPVHRAMSIVWDKYQICSAEIRIILIEMDPLTIKDATYVKIFTAYDLTTTAPNISYTAIKTYPSYKETIISSSPNNKAPVHSTTIAPKKKWISTKTTTYENDFIVGLYNTTAVVSFDDIDIQSLQTFSVEIKYDVEYRGTRHDNSYIKTIVPAETTNDVIESKPGFIPFRRCGVGLASAIAPAPPRFVNVFENELTTSNYTNTSVTIPGLPNPDEFVNFGFVITKRTGSLNASYFAIVTFITAAEYIIPEKSWWGIRKVVREPGTTLTVYNGLVPHLVGPPMMKVGEVVGTWPNKLWNENVGALYSVGTVTRFFDTEYFPKMV